MKKIISIWEAARIIGVTITTLRRWDKAGTLPSIQSKKGWNRRYREEDIELFIIDLSYLAEQWAWSSDAFEPEKLYYCSSSDIFRVRLDKMVFLLSQEKSMQDIFPLVWLIVGEIGNNSFDHNLGKWQDIPGIYFAYDLKKRIIVLADRGQWILNTLKRVEPKLSNHSEALKMAFTKIITGRAPENRGNGLKSVKETVDNYWISLVFQTGDAKLELPNKESKMNIIKCDNSISWCLAIIKF